MISKSEKYWRIVRGQIIGIFAWSFVLAFLTVPLVVMFAFLPLVLLLRIFVGGPQAIYRKVKG